MGKLVVAVPVVLPESDLVKTCLDSQVRPEDRLHFQSIYQFNKIGSNLGVTGSLQQLYKATKEEFIAFFHSDLEILEPWAERVLQQFESENVAVVGFGGALQLGVDDIYKTPYELTQLRRVDYVSNTIDAETHGRRSEKPHDVATLDGFSLIVRRELLDRLNGWDLRFKFHNYDNWLCMMAKKLGYKTRMLPVKCHHHGGQTSTGPAASDLWRSQGTSDQEIHTESHKLLYELGRGVLPIKVQP
jgi:GT2 family glycosyltransferase